MAAGNAICHAFPVSKTAFLVSRPALTLRVWLAIGGLLLLAAMGLPAWVVGVGGALAALVAPRVPNSGPRHPAPFEVGMVIVSVVYGAAGIVMVARGSSWMTTHGVGLAVASIGVVFIGMGFVEQPGGSVVLRRTPWGAAPEVVRRGIRVWLGAVLVALGLISALVAPAGRAVLWQVGVLVVGGLVYVLARLRWRGAPPASST